MTRDGTQLDLLAHRPKLETNHYDGDTFDQRRDGERCHSIHTALYEIMRDGRWYTLRELEQRCGGSGTSISARIRDFRKSRFKPIYPCTTSESRNFGGGLWKYRIVGAPKK